jgi:hypothetical protein
VNAGFKMKKCLDATFIVIIYLYLVVASTCMPRSCSCLLFLPVVVSDDGVSFCRGVVCVGVYLCLLSRLSSLLCNSGLGGPTMKYGRSHVDA